MSRARDTLGLLRGYRRQRRRRSDRPVDAVTMIGAAIVLGGFPAQLFVGLILMAREQDSSFTRWAAVGLSLLFVGGTAALLRALGPIVVGRATAATLLAAPIRRRSVLLLRYLLTLALTGVVGGLVAVGAAAVGGVHQFPGYLAAALTGTGIGLSLHAGSVLLQRRGGSGVPALLATAAGLAAVAVAAAGRWSNAPMPWPAGTPTTTVTPIVCCAAGVLMALLAWWVLDHLPVTTLTTGDGLVTAARASGSFLDLSLLGGVLSQRRALQRGSVRFRALPSTRDRALLGADLRRLLRFRTGLAIIVGLVAVMYGAAVVLPVTTVGVFATLAAAGVATIASVGLRMVCRSAALRRMLGGTDASLKQLHLVLPTATVLCWTAMIAPALGSRPVAWLLTSLGGLLFCLIQSTPREPDFSAPGTDMGFGMIQPGVILALLPGYLALGLVCVAQFAIGG